MIIYRKSWLGLGLMRRMVGSALPRALPPALLSTMICLLLETCVPSAILEGFFLHPYPFQVFSYIVAFALVFRTNTAHTRYWEMRSNFAQLTSKWSCAAAFALSFEELATHRPADSDDQARTVAIARRSQALLIHRFSLLHALALQYLRRDNDISDARLTAASAAEQSDAISLGAEATAAQEGDECDERGHHIGPMSRGRRQPRRVSASGTASPSFVASNGVDVLREKSAAAPTPLASSAERYAWVYHSLFEDQDAQRRHEEILSQSPLPVLGGLGEGERAVLERYSDRVSLVYSVLLGQLGARRRAGGLAAEAPVYTRVLQVLSDGMLGFNQARKIEDTPFPFPYAQLLAFMLYAFGLLFPVLASSKIGTDARDVDIDDEVLAHWRALQALSHLGAPGLTFVIVLSYFGMHEVARDLEDPFIHPPNDLPAAELQRDFNARLLAAWDGCRRGDAGEARGEFLPDSGRLEALLEACSARERERVVASPEVPQVDGEEGGAGATSSDGHTAPPALSPPLARPPLSPRQQSTPNRFWEVSTSSGAAATSPLVRRVRSEPPPPSSQGSAPPPLL